jgi:SAM-dependent methyltransferase
MRTSTLCALCGTELAELFQTRDYRRPNDPTLYAVGWCKGCHYGRVLGHFTPRQVSSFYDIPYYTHGDSSAGRAPPRLLERARVHLAWRMDRGCQLSADEGQGTSLLDIGCGGGANLAAFSALGFTAIGVEPDAAARREAAKYGRVLPGTAESLPEEVLSRSYDTVLLSHVLEHCIDPAVALNNVKEVIAKGGRLIVEVPNNAAFGFWHYRQSWPWSDVPRHLHFFTRESLKMLLQRCGFEVDRTIYVGFCRQYQPGWINEQNRIAELLSVPPASAVRAWAMLLRSTFASKARKYDSLRVHAKLA